MKYSAFCVCLFSAVSAPVFAFDKQQALADPFVAACVDTIQDRLVAPSTFDLVDVIMQKNRPASFADYQGWTGHPEIEELDRLIERKSDPSASKRLKEVFDAQPYELKEAFIKYDDENSFGTPIRGLADCTALNFDDVLALQDSNLMDARIDGYDKVGWAVAQMVAANGGIKRWRLLPDWVDPMHGVNRSECPVIVSQWDGGQVASLIKQYGAPTSDIVAACRAK